MRGGAFFYERIQSLSTKFCKNFLSINSTVLFFKFINFLSWFQTLVPEIWKGFPAGTSMKLLDHWLQQMEVNEFRKYDYGSVINNNVYGTAKPPYYDISRIKVPTAVFWGPNDILIGKEVSTLHCWNNWWNIKLCFFFCRMHITITDNFRTSLGYSR